MAIHIAKLGSLDVAELRGFGFIPACRIWASGKDITETLPPQKRFELAEQARRPRPGNRGRG